MSDNSLKAASLDFLEYLGRISAKGNISSPQQLLLWVCNLGEDSCEPCNFLEFLEPYKLYSLPESRGPLPLPERIFQFRYNNPNHCCNHILCFWYCAMWETIFSKVERSSNLNTIVKQMLLHVLIFCKLNHRSISEPSLVKCSNAFNWTNIFLIDLLFSFVHFGFVFGYYCWILVGKYGYSRNKFKLTLFAFFNQLGTWKAGEIIQ